MFTTAQWTDQQRQDFDRDFVYPNLTENMKKHFDTLSATEKDELRDSTVMSVSTGLGAKFNNKGNAAVTVEDLQDALKFTQNSRRYLEMHYSANPHSAALPAHMEPDRQEVGDYVNNTRIELLALETRLQGTLDLLQSMPKESRERYLKNSGVTTQFLKDNFSIRSTNNAAGLHTRIDNLVMVSNANNRGDGRRTFGEAKQSTFKLNSLTDVLQPLANGATATEAIEAQKRQICETFNQKPKDGIAALKGLCGGLDEAQTQQQIASFLLNNSENLNLAEVGDYLSGPEPENAAVLKKFTAEYAPNMAGQDFNGALRSFLKTMKLPGEAQKIDRMVQAFANSYVQQNPGSFANGDAAYTLAFSTIMLNTDLHNPAIKNHMTFEQFVRNNRGMNGGGDFDRAILKKTYDDIKSKPIEVNFAKTPPSYELNPDKLGKDKMLGKVTDQLGNNRVTALGIEGATATVTTKKPWHGGLTGYKSTVEVTKDGNKVTVEISKPGFFSREKPSVVIKATAGDGSSNLAAQVAARFDAETIPKANFAYEREDMNSAVQQQRAIKNGQAPALQQTQAAPAMAQAAPAVEQAAPAVAPELAREQVLQAQIAELGIDENPNMAQAAPAAEPQLDGPPQQVRRPSLRDDPAVADLVARNEARQNGNGLDAPTPKQRVGGP
jgi:guanine nucleotide exchange protein RalF